MTAIEGKRVQLLGMSRKPLRLKHILSGIIFMMVLAYVGAVSLIHHGDADPTIPIKFSQILFEKANQPKQFVLLKGRGHYFTDVELETELQFFMAHAKPD